MLRALVFALLSVAVPHAASVQNVVVLRIKVVLVDGAGKATPVPRHALLVSDNPASAPPRQVVTALDGTAEIKLRPGSYLIESDRPVLFQGKAYQWTEIVEIAAGREAVLELTADKAEVEAAPATAPATTTTATTAGSTARVENDPAFLLPQWQDSVVVLWTPTTRATGFVVNALGLIATNNRGIGGATSVEVQLTPSIKVAGSVIAADAARDVAIVWIDPQAIASVRPVPMPCAEATKPTISRGQEIFAIGAPFRRQKGMTPGTAGTAHQHVIASDLLIARGGAGGPVFSASGTLVGITSIAQDKDEGTLGNTPIARIEGACEVVAAAETKMKGGAAPAATHLPVEPATPFPVDAIKDIVQRRAGSLSPYEMAASAFDVAFITPVLTYGAQYQSDLVNRRGSGGARIPPTEPASVRPLLYFANWSDYLSDFPAVLLVRVTPKLTEGFWTTVGRAAARTQGMAIPPIKRFSSGFLRLSAFCGDKEVTPIHPFKLEQRISENDSIYEGLYVFDPGALGPQCGSVKLVLYSEKEPAKGDARVVDPKMVQQIWDDFAAYRDLKR